MKWRKHQQQDTSSLELKQAEKLRELGAYLHQVRLEQAMSLEQAAFKTRIRLGQLQAIETAQIEQLPDAIYLKSFIKQYADILGLDGTELSKTFPINSSFKYFQSSWHSSATQLRPIDLYLLYIFVVICAVIGLSNLLSRSELRTNSNQLPATKPTKILLDQKQLNYPTLTANAVQSGLPISNANSLQLFLGSASVNSG